MNLAVTLGLGVVAVTGGLDGDLQRSLFAVVAFGFVTRGRLAGLVAAGICLGCSEYACGGLAAVGVLANQLTFSSLVHATRSMDAAGLARAFSSLPPGLTADLRILAAGKPITTWHLVTWARREAGSRWPTRSASPSSDDFDGALLDGNVSQYAAEAVVMAEHLAQASESDVDEQILGVAATCIPLSIGEELYPKAPLEEVLRMSDRQFAEAFFAFGRSPLGGPPTSRIERLMHGPAWQREALSREQIASMSASRATLAQLAMAGLYVWALGSVLLDGIKALKPRRRERPAADPSEFASTAGVPASTPSSPTRSPALVASKPQPSPATPPAPPKPRPPSRTRRALSFWDELAPSARRLWLSRPVFMVAALTVPIVLGTAAWWTVFAAAVVAGVKGIRHPALAVLALVALAPLSWLAAAILGARLLVGEVALRSIGRSEDSSRREVGIAQVIAVRRRLTSAADLGEKSFDEELELREASARKSTIDEDEQFEHAAKLIGAALAEFRPRALLFSLRLLWRGGVLGHWDNAGPADFEAGFRHLFLLSEAGEFLIRVGLVLGAGIAAAIFAEPQSWLLAEDGLFTRLPATLVAGLVTAAAGGRPPSLAGAAFWSVIAFVVMRSDALLPVAIGAGGAAITQSAKAALELRLLSGSRTACWKPPRRTPRPLRARWKAAQRAAEECRYGLAIEVLDETVRLAPSENAVFVNDCHAQLALWQLEIGEVGAASRSVDRVGASDPQSLSARAMYSLGLCESRFGDDTGAVEHLSQALRSTTDPLFKRRIAVSLAEALARRDETQKAVAVLAEHPPSALGAQGLATMLDAETAVVLALHRANDWDAATSRLETVLGFASFDDAVSDKDSALADAQGRAFLLAGRWALSAGQSQSAEKHLRQAYNWLKGGHDEYARATARVLHGCAMTRLGRHDQGVQAIEAGLGFLEDRRTKLAQGDRRATMIVAGEETYDLALTALAAANRAGVTRAGSVAATLIESLRRSAISQALRQGPELLAEALGPMAVELQLADDGDLTYADLAGIRDRLAKQVNDRFADAYLPSGVTPEELLAVARDNGHVLGFHIAPSALKVWRVWLKPDGEAEVAAVEIPDDSQHPLARLQRGESLSRLELFSPWDADAGAVAELSEVLLPERLKADIRRCTAGSPLRLLVVPDGYLAGVPWPALPVGGEPLVCRALVQLTPSLDLLGPIRPRVGTASVLAFPDDGAVAELSTHTAVQRAIDRDEFLDGLRSERHAGAYVGTHGERSGMDARVSFGDGQWLSAGSALRYRWPDWVVFAACVVGRYEPQIGKEPLGMPISCMLGGAGAVIAAVVEIAGSSGSEVTAASRLSASVAGALSRQEHPAEALRNAQLQYLSETNLPTVGEGLSAVCLSSRPLEPLPRER